MAQLTSKQEAFCPKIAVGRSKSQAYREAYDARGMSEQSVWCEAHRLSVHPKVAPRLAEIQSECSERLVSSAIAAASVPLAAPDFTHHIADCTAIIRTYPHHGIYQILDPYVIGLSHLGLLDVLVLQVLYLKSRL